MRSSLQHSLDSVMQKDDPACPAKFIETPAHWVYTQHKYPSKPEGKTRLLEAYPGRDVRFYRMEPLPLDTLYVE